MVGEEVALTAGPYASTALAITAVDLLPIGVPELLPVLITDRLARDQLVDLLYLRDRPRRSRDVLVHRREDDGRPVIVLKDARRGAYYRLSEHGWWIWSRLDGRTSLRDLTLGYLEAHRSFSPGLIAAEIRELEAAGFVEPMPLRPELRDRPSRLERLHDHLRPLVEYRVPVPRSGDVLRRLHRLGGHLLFRRPTQLLFALVAVAGLLLLAAVRPDREIAVPFEIVVLGVAVAAVWHELGHAMTATALGRDVSLGFGWYWFAPLVYVDTSDTWLSGKWPRIAVSIAGPYASVILGGVAAVAAWLLPAGPTADALWLFALLSYIWAVLNLDPLLEYDGYYIVSDLLDRPNLRADAFGWLGTEMLPAVRRDGLRGLRGHVGDLVYVVAAIVYVVTIAVSTVVLYGRFVEDWAATWLPAWAASALGWILAAMVVVASAVAVLGSLRRHAPGRRRVPGVA
jgi:putative peptide zinc metalloprotease protein